MTVRLIPEFEVGVGREITGLESVDTETQQKILKPSPVLLALFFLVCLVWFCLFSFCLYFYWRPKVAAFILPFLASRHHLLKIKFNNNFHHPQTISNFGSKFDTYNYGSLVSSVVVAWEEALPPALLVSVEVSVLVAVAWESDFGFVVEFPASAVEKLPA